MPNIKNLSIARNMDEIAVLMDLELKVRELFNRIAKRKKALVRNNRQLEKVA